MAPPEFGANGPRSAEIGTVLLLIMELESVKLLVMPSRYMAPPRLDATFREKVVLVKIT